MITLYILLILTNLIWMIHEIYRKPKHYQCKIVSKFSKGNERFLIVTGENKSKTLKVDVQAFQKFNEGDIIPAVI